MGTRRGYIVISGVFRGLSGTGGVRATGLSSPDREVCFPRVTHVWSSVREAAAAEMEAMMEPEPEPEPAEGSRAAALIYSGERGRRSSSCGVFGCGWVSMR